MNCFPISSKHFISIDPKKSFYQKTIFDKFLKNIISPTVPISVVIEEYRNIISFIYVEFYGIITIRKNRCNDKIELELWNWYFYSSICHLSYIFRKYKIKFKIETWFYTKLTYRLTVHHIFNWFVFFTQFFMYIN